MKVKINKEKCIGCGACVSVCPDVFELRDGKACAKISETDKKCTKEAVTVCPVNAIKVN